jgi:hypothetical protein
MLDNSEAKMDTGMTREAYLEFKLNSLMVETPAAWTLDLNGARRRDDCYCYLTSFIIVRLCKVPPMWSWITKAGMNYRRGHSRMSITN